MQNFLIILGSLLFLIFLWIFTYKNILNHSVQEIKKEDRGMRSKVIKVHDKLPYLLEVLKDHKAFGGNHGQDIVRMRAELMGEDVSAEELFALYKQVYTYLEEVFAMSEKGVKTDTGFLEVRAELQDMQDQLRINVKGYNTHVNEYNAKLIKFPGNLVGSLFKMSSQRELK